jgi:hypothetical protein
MVRILQRKQMQLGMILLGAAASLGVSMILPAAGRSITAQASPPPQAITARTITLNVTGRLHLTSRHNFTLNEQGLASGTIKGAIYVRLTAVSSSRVTVAVDIRPPGGSISGSGAGSYRRLGRTSSFYGSMSLGRGTGRYGHVHGSGLCFKGTIEESHGDAITVYVTGRISD